ncbi:restriction endonuclease subunit S, partial [Lactiplantibacillus plantarum]
MKNENLVPKVRFKGFSDPWEQRKLKLLADFSKGAGYSKKDIIDQGTPIVLYGRLYTNYQVNITTIKDTFVKVRPGSVFSECNDVIVPASGETAEDIARASHVCISGAVLGGDLNIIKPKINIIDSSFLALCISNGQQNKELIKRAQGKSIVHLHNSDLKQVVLKYPSKRNQSMIARIFDKTDNLIAANEDKLEQLKTLKKLMMQKIFSQEWRFKGFTDPWEQRKLCQIATINPKSVISPHFLYVDLESVSQNRVTQYKAVTKDDAPSRAQRLAKKGDIFFQNVRPYQKNNLLFLTNKNNVVFSTGYTQI